MRVKTITGALILLGLIWGRAEGYPDRVAGSLSLSANVQAVDIVPTDRFVYVLGSSSGSLSVVDTLFFEETAMVSFSGTGRDLAVREGGEELYLLTDTADQIIGYTIEDPALPQEPTLLSTGTSGVTFDELVASPASGSDLLVLVDRTGEAIYLYNRDEESLRTSGSADHISLNEEPIRVDLSPDGNRLAVLSATGGFRTYNTASLSPIGGEIDLGSFTASADFSHILVGNVAAGFHAFASNALAAGELFAINMVSSTTTPFVIDADLSTPGSTDPLLVGDSPGSSLVTEVRRPDDSSLTSDTYLFVADQTAGSMAVVPIASVGGDTLAEVSSLTGLGTVPPRGLAHSSVNEGYLYVGDSAAAVLRVITDQPFLTLVSTPASPTASAEVSVVLNSSRGGTLKAVRYTGGSDEAISSTAGELLAEATISADVDSTLAFSTEAFVEGENTVAFFVVSGEYLGRSAVRLTKDTVPPAPTDFELSFGNEKIFATWDRVQVDDLSHYWVYFGEGTADGGISGLTSPQQVDPSVSPRLTLSPVPNGTTLSVRVTAVDLNGNESTSTETLTETAEETIGILGFSSELGGCAWGGGEGIVLLALLLILIGVRRLRLSGGGRRRLWIFWGVLFLALSAPKVQADSYTVVGFRAELWRPADPVLRQFLGDFGNVIYMLRGGGTFGNFELALEAGFFREKPRMLGVTSGRISGESSTVTLVPIEVSAQYNLRWHERPWVVPYARLGYNPNYFRVSEPGNRVQGVKHSLQACGGVRFMMNRLMPSNDFEEMLGIRSLYIELGGSYRHQFNGGLDFGGWILQPGLGFEF